MGLTKQYLRYAPSGSWSVVASGGCNTLLVSLVGVSGRYVAVGASEHVIIWDMRLGEKTQVLLGEKVEVSQIAASPSGNHMAVGYADGNISIFELTNNEVVCVFAGHKSHVTSLQYDEQGLRLLSGAKDTEVILWDVVAETGVARFSGHKGAVTSVAFINNRNCILSASKDTFVKFWDIETKHCFKTLGGHQAEVWAAVLVKDDRYLVTGSAEHELRVWTLRWTADDKDDTLIRRLELVKLEETEAGEDSGVLQCHQAGTLMRGGRGRVVGLATDAAGTALACYGTDSTLELFSFCSDEVAKQRMDKRVKKQRKKLQKQKECGEADDTTPEVPQLLTLSDEVRRLTSVKMSAKVKSVSVVTGGGGELRCAVTLANNVVELHSVDVSAQSEVRCLRSVQYPGHRADPRVVVLSSDNLAVLSASVDSLKLWNRPSQTPLRTVEMTSGRPLCACFVPGDRHALVGCSTGSLLIVDVAVGAVLEEIAAHSNDTWCVGLTHDQRGCYSGGGDKTVKLWQFELIPDPSGESKAKVLSLLHTRTLELEETVLAVKISPNSKFIAVALLDSTVKIFFLDTFKFYLSLYGHKLPVLCLDVSYDSHLMATGSADRSVKIWGMDFGDCHRSIFAHNDSVTALQFVPGTHYFFTSSKDGKVKQWDADSYDNIITLQGHAGECWSLSVGSGGLHVVSCGSDRALRLYTRTDEPLVLGDIDEEEEGLATGEKAPVPGLPNLNMPSKRTIGSEKAAESILECLDVGEKYRQETAECRASAAPPPPLLMTVYSVSTPEDFLLEIVKKIRASDLEEALLLLPFSAACQILQMLPKLLERSDHTELLCRLSVFLLRVHHASIVANHSLLKHTIQIQAMAAARLNELRNPQLTSMYEAMYDSGGSKGRMAVSLMFLLKTDFILSGSQDTVGYNVHAMKWVQRELEAAQGEQLFQEVFSEHKKRDRKRRVRQALKRPIVVVS